VCGAKGYKCKCGGEYDDNYEDSVEEDDDDDN
jgi:hypothetical protein